MSITGQNAVSFKDYQGVEGFGSSSQGEVDALNKALSAGASVDAPGSLTAGDGFALRVESLENTLKSVTFRAEHLRLYKAIPKLAAYNTVEEHNVLHSFGSNRRAGWISEGDLPNEDDSTYERAYAQVKFLGTVRRVTHVMSLVKPAHGNVIAQETINGTMHVLEMLESALFYGDSSLSSLQFDGFEKLLMDNAPASNIIDLRGAPLSEDWLTDGALTISDAPNYGRGTNLHANPKVINDLAKTFFPKERHDTFTQKDGVVGLALRGFTSMSGQVQFDPNVFITDGGAVPTAAIGPAASIPSTPTESTAADAAADASAQFTADDAGTYSWSVIACNQYGCSAPLDLGAVAIAAGEKMTVGVTPAGSVAVEWYELYRTALGGTDRRQVLRVANGDGAGEATIEDLNARLPGTTNAFMFQQNLEAMSLKQLAPMIKIPLATIDSSIRWMQLLYCVPVMYAYGKHVIFKNVGRADGYVGAL